MSHRRTCLVLLCLVTGAARAGSQSAPTSGSADSNAISSSAPASQPEESPVRDRTLGIWMGTALHSPFSTRLGHPGYRDLYLIGLRKGRTIASGANVSLDYIVDLVPIVVSTANPNGFRDAPCPQAPAWVQCTYRVAVTGAVYGAGLSPLGMELRLLRHSPVQFLLSASGGALMFSRPVPDPDATRFNFTAAAGGAVQIATGGRSDMLVGWMFHHTSNAGTGRVNPGLNSHVFYVGLTRRRE